MLDRVLRGGDWERVKYEINFKTTKQTTRQIEFSDAFKTKIGSCSVRAAIIRKWAFLYNCTAMSYLEYDFKYLKQRPSDAKKLFIEFSTLEVELRKTKKYV